MWQELASYPINNGDAQCAFLGTCWEYMGSTEDHHFFLHTLHPVTEKREYIYLERPRAAVRWATTA